MFSHNCAEMEFDNLGRESRGEEARKFLRYNYAVNIYKHNGVFLGSTINISEEGIFLKYDGPSVDFEEFISLKIKDPEDELPPILGLGELRWRKTIDGKGYGIRFQPTNRNAMRRLLEVISHRVESS